MVAYSRWRNFLSYILPYWRQVILGIISLLIVNALSAYIPLLIRNGIEQFQVTFGSLKALNYVRPLVIVASLQWILRIISRTLIFRLALQVELDLRQKIFEKLITLDTSFFDKNLIGDLINKATSDVNKVRRLIVFIFLSLTNIFFVYIFTLPLMFYIDIWLSLSVICVLILLPFIVHFFRGKITDEQILIQEKMSDLSNLIQEDLNGIATIKIYVQEGNEYSEFRRLNTELLEVILKQVKTQNILFPSLQSIGGLCLLILMSLGFSMIANNSFSASNFIALIFYTERLIFPTALVGTAMIVYQTGKVSFDRVESILTARPKIQNLSNAISLPICKIKGSITVDHLNYIYPGSSIHVLNDICFTIESGKTVSIVGPVGSGKSTLANSLLRLIDIEKGKIFLDKIDITQLRLQDLRAAISYVPQEAFLFSNTIQDNIQYGNLLANQGEIEKVSMKTKMHSEILDFPQGYKTMVGERGIRLSGGQRQRISLARAMLADSPILILDDVFSSIDNQTATEILKNIMANNKNKTLIFISHRLSISVITDHILVIDQGRIIQAGSHNELVKKSGLYQSLWNRQQMQDCL